MTDKPYWLKNPSVSDQERFQKISELLKKKNPRTVRNISYKLYPKLEGKPLDRKYNRTIKDTVIMRMQRLMNFTSIKETRTHVHEIDNYDTLEDFVEYLENIDLLKIYHRNKKPAIKEPIEVWFEKETVFDVFQMVCDKYTVPMLCVRGKSQLSSIRKGFERLMTGGHVLFFGDFDKPGLDNFKDIRFKFHYWGSECSFHWCGVTKEQIGMYSNRGYRLDGFDDEDLTKIIEECILKYVDLQKYNELVEQEKQEKELLKNFSIKVNRGGGA